MNLLQVETIIIPSTIENSFNNYIIKRKPVIVKNLYVGDCLEKWTFDYLSKKCGEKSVKIHVCPDPKMNFMQKNFLYRTLRFDDFLERIQKNDQEACFVSKTEKYYLRSLGEDSRKEPSNIKISFPEIESDFFIPDLFPKENFHSSVFRISSKGVQLWTHYDIMDNILIVISGCKRVALFPPEDIDCLYMNGDKSEITDIDNPDFIKYPKFMNALRFDCTLNKGDILFIPALWLHNVFNIEAGVAVNVFFRHLSHEFYDSTDVYANHDLTIGKESQALVQRSIKKLQDLPQPYRSFYTRMAIRNLEQSLLFENK